MRQRLTDFGTLPILKFLGVAVVASMTTACSSDIMRFSDAPFSNPYQGRVDTTTTGSVKGIRASSLGVAPPAQSLASSSGIKAAAATQVAAAGGDAISGSAAGWTAAGGTPVTVGAGDTMEALSGRYGVPTAALRAVNSVPGQPVAGQKIIIPAYKPGAPAAKVAANGGGYAPAQSQAAQQPRTPRYESLSETPKAKPAQPRTPRYESLDKPVKGAEVRKDSAPAAAAKTATKAAKAKPQKAVPAVEDDDTPVKKATPKSVTKAQAKAPQSAKPAPKPSSKQAALDDDDQPMPPKAPMKPAKAAKIATAPETKAAKPESRPVASKPEAKSDEPARTETTASVDQEFRWPARGRVISGYGSKGLSGTNEGINIALPEGTSIKAAEGGTVAYAGEEIKGYGKMVLIRHPNGYVSAYAHNGELNVKRGDAVKRGQQIAKSGQTGNVTSPQLHFELRKGSDPVDPSKYLD